MINNYREHTMSDKLVSLNAVLALLNATSQDEITDECYDRLYNAVANMDAAPQEMSAREYTVVREKMCDSFYPCDEGCPIWDFMRKQGKSSCPDFEANHPFDFISIVEKWAREHSEEVNDEID